VIGRADLTRDRRKCDSFEFWPAAIRVTPARRRRKISADSRLCRVGMQHATRNDAESGEPRSEASGFAATEGAEHSLGKGLNTSQVINIERENKKIVADNFAIC
jgi:hypothetical protein